MVATWGVSQEGSCMFWNEHARGRGGWKMGADCSAGSWLWLLLASPVPLPSKPCVPGGFMARNRSPFKPA